MPKLRNISPLGWIDVPELGRQGDSPVYVCREPDACHSEHEHSELTDPGHEKGSGPLAPGEEFECSKDLADRLLEQVGNFEAVKSTPKREG